MRYLAAGVLAATALGGCVVHVRDRHPEPLPPPRAAVHVTYGWNHHRYAVWTEYYGCNDEEVYYLENSGYDDDDILVCLMVARRARVPVRHVFFEYDRCGRSHYALTMSYRLSDDVWFCNEVPRGYACPPYYARSYGYYWSGERHYYSNDEICGLIQLQIGFRYYGYSHTTYFREYESHRGGGDRVAFRAIVVKDHTAAGRGGKSWNETKVVVRNDRPFNAPSPQDWEKKHQVKHEEIKVRVTPQREREEQEQARQASEARKDSREQVQRQAEQAKVRRQDEDRKRDAEERARPKPVARPEARPGEKPAAEQPLPNRRPEIPRGEDPKREPPPRVEDPKREPPPRKEEPRREDPKREVPPPKEEPRRDPPKREPPPPKEEPRREPPKKEPPPKKAEEPKKRDEPQKKGDGEERKKPAPR